MVPTWGICFLFWFGDYMYVCVCRCKQHCTNKMLVSESRTCVWRREAVYSRFLWINGTADDWKLLPFKAGFPPCPHPHILPPEWPAILKAEVFYLTKRIPDKVSGVTQDPENHRCGMITYSLSSEFSPRICLWVSSQQENSQTVNGTTRNTGICVIRKSFPHRICTT